ncbi:TetR/AcrR family transcriptional regulator [Rhodovulum sp. YEN HP10]|uniref:TetR/AcrR family transcriptional regulator n=1 Tax=Rhodovulum sp. HP10 TaxID=3387397 RepID=UPI0039E0AA16
MALPSRDHSVSDARLRAVDAAIALMQARGEADFTMAELAAAAGLTEARLAAEFPDRDALLAELRRVSYDRLADRRSALYAAPGGDPAARLMRGGQDYLDFARANPALYRLMFCSPGSGGISRIIAEAMPAEALDALTEGVRRCQRQRGRRTDKAHELAFLYWTTLHGVVVLALDAGDTVEGSAEADRHWAKAAASFARLTELICASSDG